MLPGFILFPCVVWSLKPHPIRFSQPTSLFFESIFSVLRASPCNTSLTLSFTSITRTGGRSSSISLTTVGRVKGGPEAVAYSPSILPHRALRVSAPHDHEPTRQNQPGHPVLAGLDIDGGCGPNLQVFRSGLAHSPVLICLDDLAHHRAKRLH